MTMFGASLQLRRYSRRGTRSVKGLLACTDGANVSRSLPRFVQLREITCTHVHRQMTPERHDDDNSPSATTTRILSRAAAWEKARDDLRKERLMYRVPETQLWGQDNGTAYYSENHKHIFEKSRSGAALLNENSTLRESRAILGIETQRSSTSVNEKGLNCTKNAIEMEAAPLNDVKLGEITSTYLHEQRILERHGDAGSPSATTMSAVTAWIKKAYQGPEKRRLWGQDDGSAYYTQKILGHAIGNTNKTKGFPTSVKQRNTVSNGKYLHGTEYAIEKETVVPSRNGAAVAVVNGINSEVTETKAVPLDIRKMLTDKIYGQVFVVDSISVAKEVVQKLTGQYRHRVYGCDTEVKINLKLESPVGHGEIICFSIYGGPDLDFGNGKSCIWVDVLVEGGKDILVAFAPFFEDHAIKKVWHNYSFDNHIVENYGITLRGFHADTMHMARLWDSSRRTQGGYSLEALSGNKRLMSKSSMPYGDNLMGKVSMKTIFGEKTKKKDGSEGKVTVIPPVEELQSKEREPWICYSALDSINTLRLYESLKTELKMKEWICDEITKGNMFDFYEKHWRPFGELLVKMETEGILVDRAYLADIQKVATEEQQVAVNRFRNWASSYCPQAKDMNVVSDTQLRQLFYGGIENRNNPGECLPETKTSKIPNVDKVIEPGKKAATKFRNLTLKKIVDDLPAEIYTASGWPSMSGAALKILAGKVSAEYDIIDEADLQQDDDSIIDEEITSLDTEEQVPTDNEDIDASDYGTAYAAFGRGPKGKEACHAIAALCQFRSIDTLLSNFIRPLQESHISGNNGRIHCSLNINTETGRLSARKPNLQNQPALEKDRYKIRQAFIAAPGNSLIVADYGQLELRILAHLAGCKSMLDAFKAGGDFHSRTAMNMYPHIRTAVDEGQVLLEWDPQPGEDKPPVPLLKDKFAAERRKAKTLNFSIAYGKTPVGLSRDWKVSVSEAKKTVELWYKERQEVMQWQEIQKRKARTEHCVHTLLGRSRLFPSLDHATSFMKGRVERAAINTPVQGSAADVVMCAMIEISKNERLKKLGWKLLLQIHDEVILEGPTETSEIAKHIVVECMANPFDGKNILNVDLSVDAKCAKNWYAGK